MRVTPIQLFIYHYTPPLFPQDISYPSMHTYSTPSTYLRYTTGLLLYTYLSQGPLPHINYQDRTNLESPEHVYISAADTALAGSGTRVHFPAEKHVFTSKQALVVFRRQLHPFSSAVQCFLFLFFYRSHATQPGGWT